MAYLSQEQADLLYAALVHYHDDRYSPIGHGHDHGALQGLGDDDHPQYLTEARGNGLYSLLAHNHNSAYSALGHNHDGSYSALGHNHDGSYLAIASGLVMMFGGASAPAGWLLCDGAAVSRTTYADLYAVIGTTYGAGDGSTTFNLPDLRGRAPIGAGQGSGLTNRTRGATVGVETHALTENEMPAHVHSVNARYATVTGSTPAVVNGASTGSYNTQSTGGGAAHQNMQPSLVLNFIIKA